MKMFMDRDVCQQNRHEKTQTAPGSEQERTNEAAMVGGFFLAFFFAWSKLACRFSREPNSHHSRGVVGIGAGSLFPRINITSCPEMNAALNAALRNDKAN